MARYLIMLFVLVSLIATGCQRAGAQASAIDPPTAVGGNSAGPVIANVTTSVKSFSIDCAPTSVTISAGVTDAAGIAAAQLWYRVGSDRAFLSADMSPAGASEYHATVNGPNLPPDRYGTLEFYITAKDNVGLSSRSTTDTSVQFLPCVSH